MSARVRSPWDSFASVVRLITALFGVYLVVSVISALSSDRADLFGASSQICVEQTEISGSSWQGAKQFFADEVTTKVEPFDYAVRFCRSDPTPGQTVLQVLTELPNILLLASVVALLWRLMENARRHGPFSLATAMRARIVGWLLLAGGFVAEAVQRIADLALLRTMLKDGAWNQPHLSELVFAGFFSASPILLITGLGMLTVARILRVGMQTREDPAGKV